MGDTQEELRKHKKYSGYVVYVAYRLEHKTALTHAARLNKASRESTAAVPANNKEDTILEEEKAGEENAVGNYYN